MTYLDKFDIPVSPMKQEILYLLDRPKTGIEIFHDMLNTWGSTSESSVYHALRKLQNAGYVVKTHDEEQGFLFARSSV